MKRRLDGSNDLIGIDRHLDQADIQSQFSERVYTVPDVRYQPISYTAKDFGLISVPCSRQGPSVPIKTFGNVVQQRQVYFRRGPKNDIAMPDDLHRIVSWIGGRDPVPVRGSRDSASSWEEFVHLVHKFEASRHYVLITTALSFDSATNLFVIGRLPWAAVYDFDFDSDVSGLLNRTKTTLQERRSLHLVVQGDQPSISAERACYWFFTRGLGGRQEMLLDLADWRSWQRKYGLELVEQAKRLACSINPSPVTCIVLWSDSTLSADLDSTFSTFLTTFGDSIEFVVVSDDGAGVGTVCRKHNAHILDIPLNQLCSGLEGLFTRSAGTAQDVCALPSVLHWL